MTIPTADALIALLDKKGQGERAVAEAPLFQQYGLPALVPSLVAAAPRMRHAPARNSALFWLVRFARSNPAVVDVGLRLIDDPAYLVRMQACSILAYSLRPDVIPALRGLLQHKDSRTRADAAAAIDAIEHRNHHRWLDRMHSGTMFWVLNPEDESPRQ
jgi:HEAT repeat protein